VNDLYPNLLAAAAGALLGLLFFGGLWWTLRLALASTRPGLLIGASALLRLAMAVAGFLAVSDGHWQRMLMCLLGFLAARWWVQRVTAGTAARTEGALMDNKMSTEDHAPRP